MLPDGRSPGVFEKPPGIPCGVPLPSGIRCGDGGMGGTVYCVICRLRYDLDRLARRISNIEADIGDRQAQSDIFIDQAELDRQMGILLCRELGNGSIWRRKTGGTCIGFSLTLLDEAGGVQKLLAEWERI